jgi:diaminopimelate decarboxylase
MNPKPSAAAHHTGRAAASTHSIPLSQRKVFADPSTFTPHFSWKSQGAAHRHGYDELYCENVPLRQVAETYGTPTYLYSSAALAEAYRELHNGLRSVPHTLCFAVKSNANLAILSRLAKLGSGFDIVSGGELYRLGQLAVPGHRIVFSGVGKSREEIREALHYRPAKHGAGDSRTKKSAAAKHVSAKRGAARPDENTGILLFNVESEAELEVLLEEASRARKRGIAAPATAIRVNPDVVAGGHPHIATGCHNHKFGIDWPAAKRLYLEHRDSKHIRWQGISAHIGSQIVALDPFRAAFARLASYVRELQAAEIELQYLDIGGGLGVRYTDEQVSTRTNYARMVAGFAKPLGLHLLLEPGRAIIAAAGVLLTRAVYTKYNRDKVFLIVDAAMNDLMRPALYNATHPITRVRRSSGADHVLTDAVDLRDRVDIVGPVCETGDCFLRDWPLGGEVHPGETLAIWTVGAYGMSQTSNYNARLRPAEVLVKGRRSKLIRRRETRKDLLRHELREK